MYNKCMGLYGNLTVCDNPNYSRNTKYVKNKSLYMTPAGFEGRVWFATSRK